MDYERDNLYTNMYLGNEIRFDGIARAIKSLTAKLSNHPTARPKPVTA